MLIARVDQASRTERMRAVNRAAAGRGWVDPGAAALVAPRPPPAAAAGGPVAALAGLEALLVLQRVEEPAAPRQRAARQGARLLDGLDALRQGLLAGALPEATLHRLRRDLAELDATPEDPRLQAVLREIALRVEVELAKFERDTATDGAGRAAAEAAAAGLKNL